MTDPERFIREAEAANQRRADQIENASGEEEDDYLSRHDHVYGGFVHPNVLHEEVEEDEVAPAVERMMGHSDPKRAERS